MEELRFWTTHLNSIKVRDCFLIDKRQRFVYSHANATGCGSVVPLMKNISVKDFGNHLNARFKISYRRKLAAIEFSLESYALVLEGSLVN